MDVNSFLSAVKPTSVSVEPQAVSEGADLPEALHGDTAVGSQSAMPSAPSDLTKDITPSGIEVAYQSRPKRLYQVRGPGNAATDFLGDRPWTTVPSVTTVLDLLQKGGLTVWGQRVGIQGVLTLFEQDALTTCVNWNLDREIIAIPQGEDHIPADVASIEALMKERKLTTNDVKDSAADRGTNVHDALEEWAKTGHLPNAREFPPAEAGYVEGLIKFLDDARPEPVRTEVMVGSVEHGYAGRYDLELRFNETRKVRKTPKQKWHEIEPGTFLCDLKSSKGVYPSTHFRQLAAYEGARIECGYEPTDGQYVLNVNGEGSYAFVKSTAVLDDFLSVLSVYRSDVRMKEAA